MRKADTPFSGQITEDQVQEHTSRFTRTIRELTVDEYNAIREDEDYKKLARQLDGKIKRIVARRNSLGKSLPVDLLPDSGYDRANTALLYDWENGRPPEEARYETIKAYFSLCLGIEVFDLVESGPQDIPDWPQILVVSPVDLAVWLGYNVRGANKKHTAAYCDMTYSLVLGIPSLWTTDWIKNDCFGIEGARLEANAYRQWSAVPGEQKKGQPLKIRRMCANPATWFGFDRVQYSLPPLHVRVLANLFSIGSRVRSAACGDLVAFASLAVGEPQILTQITKGTCPRIDILGTELCCDGEWARCPVCTQYDSKAWITDFGVDFTSGYFGSFLFAVK